MLNLFLKKFAGGTKSDRDIKAIMPVIEKTKKEYERISRLDNDGLRQMTQDFRRRIAESVRDEEAQIEAIRQRIDAEYEMDIDEKENLYKQLDSLEKQAYDKTQEVLNAIIPEAFSVIKETGKRFKENETVAVTATDFDRDLAARKGNVNIVDGKAYWDNRWMAGGNMITWDMVHYDVQLIGVWFFIRVKLPRWPPVKEKRWLRHCQSI